MDMEEMCNGECNDHPHDMYQHSERAYVKVCEGKCSKKADLCNGHILDCQEELEWCQSKTRLEEKCVTGLERTHCLGKIPGQCILKKHFGDNKYDCLDRSDEVRKWILHHFMEYH